MCFARRTAVAGAVLLACALTLQAQDTPPAPKGEDSQAKSAPSSEAKYKGKSARGSDQTPERPGLQSGIDATKATQSEEKTAIGKTKNGNQSEQAAPRREAIGLDERIVQFSFAKQPWDTVLDWIAELSGLSLQMRVKPPGTFNYINDPSKYTLGEAMDILNAQLIPEGIVLLHKANYLFVVSLKDGLPKDLVPRVTLEELDKRGESEFVTVWLELSNLTAEVVAEDLKSFKGEFGEIVPHKGLNRLLITDMVGNIRLMRGYLDQAQAKGSGQSKFRTFELKFIAVSKVEVMVREVLGLPPKSTTGTSDRQRSSSRDDPAAMFRERMQSMFGGGGPGGFGGVPFGGGGPGGDSRGGDSRGGDRGSDSRGGDRGGDRSREQSTPSVTVTVDELHNQLFVSAPPEKLAIVEQLVSAVDVPRDGQDPYKPRESQVPVAKPYRLSDADAQSLATTLTAIYKDTAGVRFSADQTNNMVIAIATPDDHKEIAKVVEEFEHDERDAVVLPLTSLDAASVETLLNNFYSSGQTDWRQRPVYRAGQPRIVANAARNQIMVRASKKQVEDIRGMLAALGESTATQFMGNEKLRVIQLNPGNAKAMRDMVEQVWPKISPNNNPIRTIDVGRRSENEPAIPQDQNRSGSPGAPRRIDDQRTPSSGPDADPRSRGRSRPAEPPRGFDGTSRPSRSAVRLVSNVVANPALDGQDDGAPAKAAKQDEPEKNAAPQNEQQKSGAPLVLSWGENNVVAASDDPIAIQKFVELMSIYARSTPSGGAGYTVFYLKSAEATQMQQTLNDLMGISSVSFFGSGSASQASSSTVKIVPDVRTNSLIVYASANDVSRINDLLQILDREDAPSSGAMSAPRIIPVRWANATLVSRVIRDVYAARIVGGSGGGFPGGSGGFPFGGSQFGGGSPGGFGGSSRSSRSGSGSGTLAIGVDEQSNSIVVSCSESLYQEVKKLVDTLDVAANATDRTVQIVTVQNSTPSAVQEALNGLMGVSTRTNSSGRSSSGDSSFRPTFGGGPTFSVTPFGGSQFGGFSGGSPFGGGFNQGGFNRGGFDGGGRGGGFPSFGGGGGFSPFGGGGGFGGGGSDRGRRPFEER